jgi:transposase
MAEKGRKFDPEFREGAVRIVRRSGPRSLRSPVSRGINEGTLTDWLARDRVERSDGDR